jgi:hypothetical protein
MARKQTKVEMRIDRMVAFVTKTGVEPLGFDLRLITKITV